MAKICAICGKKIGVLESRITLKDGYLCPKCLRELGYTTFDINAVTEFGMKSISEITNMNEVKQNNNVLLESFTPQKSYGDIEFNDDKKLFVINRTVGWSKMRNIYNYNQILDCELIEDGNTITKGGHSITKGVIGGVMFGGVGAIVGGLTGKKKTTNTCTNLQVKITLRDSNVPVEYVDFICAETKKNGIIYKTQFEKAQSVLSALQIACDLCDIKKEEKSNCSAADEIRKYKDLLDAGAITKEEYDTIKKQLLGL